MTEAGRIDAIRNFSYAPGETQKAIAKPEEKSSDAPGDMVTISENKIAAPSGSISEYAEHVPSEMLVRFKGAAPSNLRFGDVKLKLVKKYDLPPAMMAEEKGDLLHVKILSGQSVDEAVKVLSRSKRIQYAEPNFIYRIPRGEEGSVTSGKSPNDQEPPVNQDPAQNKPDDLNNKLWGLHNEGQSGGKVDADIDAPEAWNITTGKREGGPLIAIIDTGMDYNHPDLKDNVWTNPGEVPGDKIDNDGNGFVDDIHGYDFSNKDGDPFDDQGHGTHVAGTIGAVGNNKIGVVGVNWEARIMPVKFLSASGSGTLADAVDAIIYTTKMGARISSNSWGGGGFSESLRDAIAAFPGLFVAAAGNDSSNNDASPSYPASYDLPNIVSVAASDHNDKLAYFSNYGKTTVDLAAPGDEIYSTTPGDSYGSKSGTSMATPHVSGAAGLILSKFPEMSNEELKNLLISSADPVPEFSGKMVSGGRLNVNNALEIDTVPPGTPGDFKAEALNPFEVAFQWTASGDDDAVGKAQRYELRVADRPIVEQGEDGVPWDEAKQVDISIVPKQAGEKEECSVKLAPGEAEKNLYFALKAFDNKGNTSGMASGEATVPASSIAFKDTMEGEGIAWSAESPWAKVDVEGHGKVWTDSPDGNYENNVNTSITSPVIDLSGAGRAMLSFEEKHDLEDVYDKGYLEIKKEGSDKWEALLDMTGASEWNQRLVSLDDFAGSKVQLRFRVQSDSIVNSFDGMYVDNVAVYTDQK